MALHSQKVILLVQLCMIEHIVIDEEFLFIFDQRLHHVFLNFSISWLQSFNVSSPRAWEKF